MDLKAFIEIGGFVILVIGFFFNMQRTNQIKSNCIATLTARVDELDRKMNAICTKHDSLDDRITDLGTAFARLDQKITDKFNGVK